MAEQKRKRGRPRKTPPPQEPARDPDAVWEDGAAETAAAITKANLSTIELPLGVVEGYVSRKITNHINTLLTREQARNLKAIKQGLMDQHTKMKNGRYVQSSADAVRWILEQV